MQNQTRGELISLSPVDEVLAEIEGEIAPPSDFPSRRNGADRTGSPESFSSVSEVGREESGNQSKFKATIRFSLPFSLSKLRENFDHPAAASAPSNGSTAVLAGPRPLENTDAWFRVWFEQMPEPIFLLDPHDPKLLGPVFECNELAYRQKGALQKYAWALCWPVVECNRAVGLQNGYSREELVGQPSGLIGPRTDRSSVLSELLDTLRREKLVRIQGLDQRKDGTFFPVEVFHLLVHLSGRELVLSIHRDLTERWRIEAELEKLEAGVRLNPHPVLEFNAEGSLIRCNTATDELVRTLGEENPPAILPPGTAKVVKECLASGQSKSIWVTQADSQCLCWSFFPIRTCQVVFAHAFALRDRGQAGSVLSPTPLRQTGRPETGATGADMEQMLGLIRELTETIKSNQARPAAAENVEPKEARIEDRKQEWKEGEWWQAAADGLIDLDQEGKILSFNPAAERFTGCRASDVLGLPLHKIQCPEAERLRAWLDALGAGAGEQPLQPQEWEWTRHDESRVWLEAKAWATQRDGQVLRRHLVLRDMTERRGAEKALRKREASLSLAQRIGRMGSWELDLANSGTLEWSEEMFHLLGYQPGEIVPTDEAFYALVHPAHQEAVKQTREEAVRQGKPYSLEYRLVRRDGTVCWLFEQADAISDEAGKLLRLAGTVQDVSKRKQQEEQIRQSEKWEAIGRLAGGVAHDFNNILTDIRRCAKAIESSPNIRDDMALQIRQLSAAAQRATNLTWHLLAYTRKQAMEFKPVAVNEVINQVAQTLQRAFATQIQLQLKLTPDLPAICADVNMLEQVLLNLSINSGQNLPQGGMLTIETRVAEIDAGYVLQQPEARVGRYVCLKITDTGGGVDTTTTACLLEPFFTTKESGAGPGLGLATVYGIVKQHHGWIDVFNGLGRGKTFTVYLPAQTGKPESLATENASKPIWGGSETILLLEDEPLLRSLAQSILERYGYQIFTAGSSAEAVAVWEKNSSQIDLLMTNTALPDSMTGRDLAQQFTARKPGLKVLFVSGYSLNSAPPNGPLKLGVNFLPKPYSATALAHAVRRCLDTDGSIPDQTPPSLPGIQNEASPQEHTPEVRLLARASGP